MRDDYACHVPDTVGPHAGTTGNASHGDRGAVTMHIVVTLADLGTARSEQVARKQARRDARLARKQATTSRTHTGTGKSLAECRRDAGTTS